MDEVKPGKLRRNELCDGALPEKIIERHGQSSALERLHSRREIEVDEFRMRLWQRGETAFDGFTIVAARDDSDVVESREVDGPLPADFRLGAAARFAGVGGDENFESFGHSCVQG